MRTATVSALFAFLLLVWFPSPASGQIESATPRLSLVPNPPAFVQGSETPNSAKSGSVDAGTASSNLSRALAENSVWANPFGNDQRKVVTATGSPAPTAESPCAHILILQVPSLDSKMAKRIPEGVGGMPTVKGVPACREDIHRVIR